MKSEPSAHALGIAQVGAAAPAGPEQIAHHATHLGDGSVLRVSGPGPLARLRPNSLERVQAAALAPAGPSLAPTLAHGIWTGTPVLIRAPGRPYDPGQRLDAEQALALVQWLGPGVWAAGVALGGELDAGDLLVGADDVVRVAPSGLVRARGLQPPAHRPPETWGDGPAEGALYGLGVLAYRGLTGRDPPAAAESPEALADQLGALLPRAMPPLIAALTALLGPTPVARSAWAQGLGEAAPLQLSPSPLVAPDGPATPKPSPKPVRTAGALRDLPLEPWAVLTEPAQLTQGARDRVAALAGLSPAAVARAAEEGLPLPLAGAATQGAAEALVSGLAPAGAPLTVASTQMPWARLAGMGLGVAGLSIVLALVALVPALAGQLWASILALMLIGVSGLVGLGAVAAQATKSRLETNRIAEGHKLRQLSGQMDSLNEGVHRLRGKILGSALPTPAQRDLLDRLERLSAAHQDQRQQAILGGPQGETDLEEELKRVQEAAAALQQELNP